MKSIGQTIENSHLSSESSKTATESLQKSEKIKKAREACAYIWPILTNMYGAKFSSQFGEQVNTTWIACLAGLNELQIKKGLEACLRAYTEWPPGSAQFRALCVAGGNHICFNDPAHPHYQPKRIESDESKASKRKNAKAQIANMRNKLK